MPSTIRCSVCVHIFIFCSLIVFVSAEENLYKILGVDRSASTQQIKKAYRKKALDTHPDKNKDLPAEEAAAEFHKVVHAFEILSDASSRKRYDQTGRTDGGGSGSHGGGNGGFQQWTFTFNRRRQARPKLKDRFDVQQSQSRIIHIVSLNQLEVIITTILGEGFGEEVLERNLLICFYTPPLEKHVMEEMVYPWPFAGMSSQKIWWEDILQTTVVRFHRSNDLTEFFGIPKGNELKEPIFLFGKRGQKFRDPNAWNRRLSTNNREVFDKWVWDQLQKKITFVNKHDSTLELYWIHGNRAFNKGTIHANAEVNITTNLGSEFWMRDARTDTRKDSPDRYRLTDQTCLYNVKITSDTRTRYTIPKRDCFDLSGHCPFWNRRGNECSKNPRFMHENCALTCGLCKKHDIVDQGENNDDYEGESSAKDEL